jgi:hypothetical protein
MFQILIAGVSISLVATLALVAAFYGGSVFTRNSSIPMMVRDKRPILVVNRHSGIIPKAGLFLLVTSLVALGFIAAQ